MKIHFLEMSPLGREKMNVNEDSNFHKMLFKCFNIDLLEDSMLRGYSWLWAQGLLLMGIGRP